MKKLSESVWADIHKRSNGTAVRKEDDIDLLDRDGMYDYIFSHYEKTKYMKSEPFKSSDYFFIPLFFSGSSLYNFFIKFREDTGSAKEFTIDANIKRCEEFIDKLKEFCVIDDNGGFGITKVFPKEGKFTNSFCLKVLDTILENVSKPTLKKKDLNESVWADIHKRSNGKQVRKEDDVNLLDRDGFYKYLMEHYKTATEDVTGPYAIINSKNADYINIPIIEDDNNTQYRVIIWNFDNDGIIKAEKYITIPCKEPFWGSKLFVKIRDNFILENKKNDSFNPLFKVWPKGIVKKTELNKFFLEVIDFIIDNVEEPFEPLLKRI